MFIIGYITSFIIGMFILWRWEVLQSRVKTLEMEKGALWSSVENEKRIANDLAFQVRTSTKKIKTLEHVLRNVRANQIKQRERTPAGRPTIRNRELMRLGRDIQAGAVDKEIKRISKDD